ncbi:MAG: hypothetical protein ACO1N0_10145 [Fluviicola sp.]
MDYKSLFLETKERLIRSQAIIDLDETEVAITAGVREYYENEERLPIPDDLYELLSTLNGLEFRWSDPAQKNLGGYFNFHHVEEFSENDTENKLWADWYEAEDIEEIKTHRIFETFHGSDDYVTINIEADKSYALYYVPEGSVNFGGSKKLNRIPLTIEQYVRIVMGYLGVYSVRHHLHKPDFYANPQKYIPEYEQIQQLIPGFEPPVLSK